MAITLVLIGLACSILAFAVAIRSLSKMVKKDHITAAIPDAKFSAIRNTFISLVVATAFLYVTLISAGGYVYLQGNTTTDSLCALRGDLQTRVHESRNFLADNPKGIPGVEAKVLEEGIKNQERTIRTLGQLDC